jgi:hypothetical protein
MGFFQDLSGKTGEKAAKAAAGDTWTKQNRAIDEIKIYGDEYANKFADLSKAYDPYVSAGGSALERLMAGLGLGGDTAGFTQAYRNLPGYQAGLDSGSRAITGNAAARGMLNSGATAKGLQRYGSDYEDKRSGDYLTRLMSMTGMGQSATGQQIATEGQGLQGQLGTRTSAFQGAMNAAGTIGQGNIAAANARAAGSQNILNTGMKVGGMILGAATGNPLAGMSGSSGGSWGQGGYYSIPDSNAWAGIK